MKSKVWFFIISFVVTILILIIIWNFVLDFNNSDDIANIAVEFHGMVFDIILFGIILTIYDEYQDRKRKTEQKVYEEKLKIERLQNEIIDFQGWYENEASYRVAGNMRRLNKLGVTKFYLGDYYLVGSKFDLNRHGEIMFENTSFWRSKLDDSFWGQIDIKSSRFNQNSMNGMQILSSKLIEIVFDEIEGENFKFNHTLIKDSNFKQVNFNNSKFYHTKIENSTLSNVNLNNIEFNYAKFRDVTFTDCSFMGANFFNAELYNVKFINSKGLSWEMFELVKIINNCSLPSDVETELRRKRPQAFQVASHV